MALAVTEEELRQLLAAWPFISRMNFQIRALDDGLCTLEVPFQEASTRPGGRIASAAPPSWPPLTQPCGWPS